MATIPEALDAASKFLQAGQLPQAEEVCRRILEVMPDNATAHNTLGAALAMQRRFPEAVVSLQEAARLQPHLAEAHNNLGNALVELRRLPEAVESFQNAIRRQPDFAVAHKNLGLTLLVLGELEQGFQEYEWRWRCPGMTGPALPRPRWDGSSLAGRTILLHAEQGLGDAIQFIRYAPLVKQQGGTVLVVCQPTLVRLLGSCAGVDCVFAWGSALPPFDVHVSLMSLPALLRTTLETIPASIPYLSTDESLNARWRERLKEYRACKVGIVWQGNPVHRGDPSRSFSVSQFTPLASVEGVQLFSLQKGPMGETLPAPPCDFSLIDLAGQTADDFQETAAVIQNLDLVISADTAIVHLAGALGVPVWAAVTHASDWRWLLNREDSPWYPTLRLFRQRVRDDWEEVFGRIRAALGDLSRARSVLAE